MTNKKDILEKLSSLGKKVNSFENPEKVAEMLLSQSWLSSLLLDFINSPYYAFTQKINKKENILYILGYRLLSAIILVLVVTLKYKDKETIIKQAIEEGFKYAEAAKDEEAFLIGFISKLKNYIPTDDLMQILENLGFPSNVLFIQSQKLNELNQRVQNLSEKEKNNVKIYADVLFNLIQKYLEKLDIDK